MGQTPSTTSKVNLIINNKAKINTLKKEDCDALLLEEQQNNINQALTRYNPNNNNIGDRPLNASAKAKLDTARIQQRKLDEIKTKCNELNPSASSLPKWKKWNDIQYNNNKWNGGKPVEYIKLADGRRRKVNIINRKKHVRVKGEMVPVAEAKKIISQSRKV